MRVFFSPTLKKYIRAWFKRCVMRLPVTERCCRTTEFERIILTRILRKAVLENLNRPELFRLFLCCRLHADSCMAYSSTQKMEATCSSRTSAAFHLTTPGCISEDRIDHFGLKWTDMCWRDLFSREINCSHYITVA
jgi:hypothetical protein